MVKKISNPNVVQGSKRVLPAGHPLLFLYDPNSVIIQGDISEYDFLKTKFPVSGIGVGGPGDGDPGEDDPKDPNDPGTPDEDIIELSDIESVTQSYYKNEQGDVKVKVVFKVRNNSKNKTNVAGVDVRLAW